MSHPEGDVLSCFSFRTTGKQKPSAGNKPEDAVLLGDSTSLRINDLLYAMRQLPAKTFNIMVRIDMLHNASHACAELLDCFCPGLPEL